jgi:hypothetical protein
VHWVVQFPQWLGSVWKFTHVPEHSFGFAVPAQVQPPGFWQTLPPLQLTAACLQPMAGLQLSVVQSSLSLQFSGVRSQPVDGLQPFSTVHMLPSSQLIMSFLQPVAGSQLSAVHMLLSLQLFIVFLQPLAGTQVSSVHMLWSLQSTMSC